VNRIWQYHFGKGIVGTPNDFGANGLPPTHPELLDYLAADFVEHDWSVKHLIRQLVLSRVYRLGTDIQPQQAALTPTPNRSPPPRPMTEGQLTLSELDAIRSQIAQCWNVPAGARDARNLVVELQVEMNPDATVRNVRVVDEARMMTDAFFRAAAESALRAVRNPRCNPLRLPAEKFDTWKSFTLNFNPKEML